MLANTGVDAYAAAGGKPEHRDPTGRRREPLLGVLGAQPGLDGMAVHAGRFALEPAPRGDVELQLDQVQPRGHLRHRMLHLEPRVDLHEEEVPRLRVDEELHGARVAVPDGGREPDRCRSDRRFGGIVEHRRGGLLDHLLVASLAAAVADPHGPRGSVAVRDHLDLHVASGLDVLLEEDRRVAERQLGLAARRGQGRHQLLRRVDQPDAAPASAGSRLQEHGVAEELGLRGCLLGLVDRAAAPGDDRDISLLSEPFRGHLVAERPDGGAVGADEADAGLLAPLCEGSSLGDEAPAHPDRVAGGRDEGLDDGCLVEVARLAVPVPRVEVGRRAEVDRLVRLLHEPGLGIGVGVQRDGRDAVPGPVALGEVQLCDRGEQAHGRLAAVDDAEPADLRDHQPRPTITSRSGARTSSSSPPGSGTVR